MTFANFERALRGFCKRKPFLAFKVELVSGENFKVPHPEALILRGETAVFIGKNGRYRVFDSEGVCQFYD